jgi:hypothetical protein
MNTNYYIKLQIIYIYIFIYLFMNPPTYFSNKSPFTGRRQYKGILD